MAAFLPWKVRDFAIRLLSLCFWLLRNSSRDMVYSQTKKAMLASVD